MILRRKPKAIILDLDGTLLHSDGTISENTLEVLRECRERGIIIIVATARCMFKAVQYLDMIAPDYSILADGTQIFHNNKMLIGFPLKHSQSNGMLDAILENPNITEYFVCTEKNVLCSTSDINEIWRQSYDFKEKINVPIHKIVAIIDTYSEVKYLAEQFSCKLNSYRGEKLYSFTSKESGKLQAVSALGEILQIDLQEMIAFGDDQNDYEVLTNCGIGVAVSNAIPEIRSIADEITESNDDDGVARYLKKVLKE